MLVHAGPLLISLGQSSIIADRVGLRCKLPLPAASALTSVMKNSESEMPPGRVASDAVVIVATIRALKMHGGGPAVKPGAPRTGLHAASPELVETGCANLAHIEIVRKSGITR